MTQDNDVIFRPPEGDFEVAFSTFSDGQITDWGLMAEGIPDAHKLSQGEGIKVAILDTGSSDHVDLNDNILSRHSVIKDVDSIDRKGHGCILPTDYIYTSLCGIQTIEYIFNNAPGMEFIIDKDVIIRDVSRYNLYTLSMNKDKQIVKGKITHIHKIPYQGDIYNIKTQENELNLTPWHPTYMKSSLSHKNCNIIRADHLIPGNVLYASKKGEDIGQYINLPYRTYYECIHCGHQATGNKRKYCRKCNKKSWNNGLTNYFIVLDEKLAYWIGLLIADGHLSQSLTSRNQSIQFENKNENLISEFISLAKDIFNKNGHIFKYNRSTSSCRLYDINAYNMLKTIGFISGCKTYTVKIPEVIMKSPKSVIFAFFAGVIEGDGNISSDGKIRITTASQEFAKQTKILLQTQGLRCAIIKCKPKTNHSIRGQEVKSSVETYQIKISYCREILDNVKHKSSIHKINPKYRNFATIQSINILSYNGFVYDFTIENHNNYVANGYIVSNTHCSGIVAAVDNNIGILGVAPKSKLIQIKVMADNGVGSPQDIQNGVKLATSLGADIISISLGSTIEPPQSLHDAIRVATDQGIIVVAAAGNNAGEVGWPAKYNEVIATAAMDKDGSMAKFSSRGDKIDFGAPGVQIYSTYLNNQYALFNGTSQATPFIAGCCALIMSYLRAHPEKGIIKNYLDILRLLDKFCDSPSGTIAFTKKGQFGYGVPKFANIDWTKL